MTDTKLPIYGTPDSKCGQPSRVVAVPRKLRPDLTPEELERLQKYGSVHFESAGATRKR